jgi:hypothetical protein
VALEDDALSLVPFDELERPGADDDRLTPLRAGIDGLLLGADAVHRHREDRREDRLRRLECDLNRVGVDHLDAGELLGRAVDDLVIANDVFHVGLAPTVDIRPQLPGQRERNVVGDHFAPVVELHALAKRNGVDEPIVAHGRELGCEVRVELISRVVCVEPVEQQPPGAPPVLAPLGTSHIKTAHIA